jgi:hypothetical protein
VDKQDPQKVTNNKSYRGLANLTSAIKYTRDDPAAFTNYKDEFIHEEEISDKMPIGERKSKVSRGDVDRNVV